MPKGTIRNIVNDRGFGFIEREDGRDLFFHASGLAAGVDFASLAKGMKVSFETAPNERKPGQYKATKVEPTGNPRAAVPNQPTGPLEHLAYDFVPIDLEQAVLDRPVFHDGSSEDDLYSGELLCTMTCLTPTLAGNTQYKKEQADQDSIKKWGFAQVDKNKNVIEPLRLPDGRVVILGTALTGMFRQSLGALLCAPMERVAERHYTYRPNLGHAKKAAKLECRPAVVTNNDEGVVKVKVLPAQSAVFVHQDEVRQELHKNCSLGCRVKHSFKKCTLDKHPKIKQVRIKPHETESATLDHYLYSYAGGIDGSGILHSDFWERRNQKKSVHKEALVKYCDVDSAKEEKSIPADVYSHYQETQRILADEVAGHLTGIHPQISEMTKERIEQIQRDIRYATQLKVHQLIFVEVDLTNGKIRSMGHNYQYRWAYTSSVRKANGTPRPCLSPLAGELANSTDDTEERDAPPEQLSGCRLLFGYVHDPKKLRIGSGSFKRMAGRIAINHAVSQRTPQFLGDEQSGYCVPLRALGPPRPSACEFYIMQPGSNNPMATYGDVPRDSGGDLRGRKFYPHAVPTELGEIKATTNDDINAKLGPLARFICAADTTFNFTVRFARLRDWELGALLAVLQPERLLPDQGGHAKHYAHKLGLGRPLGMGSVQTKLDQLRVRRESCGDFMPGNAAEILQGNALKAVLAKLDERQCTNWLEILKVVRDDNRRPAYPKGGKEGTVYEWHTGVRRDYARLRREAHPDFKKLHQAISQWAEDTNRQ